MCHHVQMVAAGSQHTKLVTLPPPPHCQGSATEPECLESTREWSTHAPGYVPLGTSARVGIYAYAANVLSPSHRLR
jgi:hypothetical protein